MRRKPAPSDAFYIAEQTNARPRFCSPTSVFPEATAAFYALAKLTCTKIGDENQFVRFSATTREVVPDIGEFYPRYGALLWTCPPEQRAALSTLFNAVQAAIRAAHAEGVEHGTNLIVAMAQGEITSDQCHGLKPLPVAEEA